MSEIARAPQPGMVLVPNFLTVDEAAALLKLEPMTLRRYIWKNKGPKPTYFGRLVRIRTDELLKWSAPGRKHPPATTKRV